MLGNSGVNAATPARFEAACFTSSKSGKYVVVVLLTMFVVQGLRFKAQVLGYFMMLCLSHVLNLDFSLLYFPM